MSEDRDDYLSLVWPTVAYVPTAPAAAFRTNSIASPRLSRFVGRCCAAHGTFDAHLKSSRRLMAETIGFSSPVFFGSAQVSSAYSAIDDESAVVRDSMC